MVHLIGMLNENTDWNARYGQLQNLQKNFNFHSYKTWVVQELENRI